MSTRIRRRHRLYAATLAVFGATAALLLPASAAGAAEGVPAASGTAPRAVAAAPGDYLGTGVRIRAQANGSSTIKGLGYAGQGATVYCWQDGPAANPSLTISWYYHRNNATGVTGWSSWDVFRPSAEVPHC
ncbi:hypothetical protein AQJ11_13600 [Streptomyces corchorusii]|uniref:SH3b domain-containing protein n=2 Tax=Streptomyces TaxID=1883 RepID=A0A101QCX6_STRCK|nr:hypothetical protein [Streptomyces corchorusii]KUN27664.1 hypothetical protein AQJ11_13600 [Streptomyces corchorusii]